jgi:uridylate kinase
MSIQSENIVYKRILLKLSGESLAGEKQTGIDTHILEYFIREVKKVLEFGVQVALVIGGGNIFRGLSKSAEKMDRTTADHMGMLATVINTLALKDAFEKKNIRVVAMSAIQMPEFAELYVQRNAEKYLKDGYVVILGAGTGNPFFTTDTAAVLRAVELKAEVMLKGTRVDGVYDSDPEKNVNARRFESLEYKEAVAKGLKVMDSTALTLSMDNNLPIIVFNFNVKDNLMRIVKGENIGTKVR